MPPIRRTSANVMFLSSFHVPVCRLDYQGHGGHLGLMHIALFSRMINTGQHAKYALQTPLSVINKNNTLRSFSYTKASKVKSINRIIYFAFNSNSHVNNYKHVGSYALVFIIISY